MGKLSRITWPEEYSELQRIEELLLCGICYEYMDTSVMTPCSHNYCSLCIRKYLHYKTQCPACFEKTFEKDLHTNRILDELISYFRKISEKLVNCINGATINRNEDNDSIQDSPMVTPVRPARTNQNQKKSPKVEAEHGRISPAGLCKADSMLVDASPTLPASPSTSGTTKIANIFTPKSKKIRTSIQSHRTVPCPICKVEVSEIHVNKHLDDCLKRETKTQPPQRIVPKRKPLPKLVISLMKDAELRKKLKELGLPSQGDRKNLEARFQRYSTLYNAECDKKEPRPVEELIKQCSDEEALEKKMIKFNQAANRLKVTRNAQQNVIAEAQKKYLETHKQSYQDLIAAVKNREESRKAPARRSLIKENTQVAETEPSDNHDSENNLIPITEHEDNDAYSVTAFYCETAFQDSDSDSSCPLQHYTSDDPVNSLSLRMSTSDSSKSPVKAPRSSQSSANSSVSPVKTLSHSSSKLSTICSTTEERDIFLVTTDSDSDEDAVPLSPQITMSQFNKRAKLSVSRTNNNTREFERNQQSLEGQNLALSIAQDFTFDISSDDSVGSNAINERIHNKTSEKINAKAHKTQLISDVSNIDKENHESATTSANIVNRPLRMRNCVIRLQSVGAVASEKSKETMTAVTGESHRSNASEEDKTEDSSRVDSPLKRRRRRKVTPTENEAKNPPRRPLRKRNSVVQDDKHKRT